VNNPVSLYPHPSNSQTLLSPALLTLDKNGVIVAANSAALRFWQTTAGLLTGTPLARLFVFDHTSAASAEVEAQWSLLLANALNRTIACQARQSGNNLSTEVGVRIEETQGGAPGYFAIVDDPVRHNDSTSPIVFDSGLALLADDGVVGFFDLNFKDKRIYYSPAWKKMLGYSDQELPNSYDSWQRLIHPEDSAAAPDRAPRKPQPGEHTFSVEIRMRHHAGHYLWVECIGTQVIGADSVLERVSGIQLDIDERKELDEQSMLNEERLQKITGQGLLVAFDFDFAHGNFWLSSGWKKLTGRDRGEADSVLDTFLAALPQAEALRGAEAFFLGPSPTQEFFLETILLRTEAARPLPVLIGAHRQLTRKSTLARVIGFCCPLPAILNANLAAVSDLPIPASLIAGTIASLAEAIIVADNQGRIAFLNPQAERLTGCTLERSRGMTLGHVFRLANRVNGHPDGDALDLALAAGELTPLCANHALSSGDGKSRPIVWRARQILGADNRIEGAVVVFRDPHEMTLTPEELISINRWESLGVIAGGISHDFNNLLTTILGGISHAKDNNNNAYLADSERACLAAKSLTKQLLAAAKGGALAASQTLSPYDLLEEAVRLARAGATAEIKLTVPKTISPIRVNHAQIMQVFQNLIINALQAVPATGGKISIAADNTRLPEGGMPPLPAGNYVAVEIRDNGSGIARENLDKIFEPFFTTKKQGTGLGLSTVRSLVRKHGGQISVASTVGEGTVFRVLLPQADQPAEAATRRTPILRTGTGRILLMDDDPDISRLAAGMLASLDYKYDVARKGEEAIDLYSRYLKVGRPYDLVILDLTVVGGLGGEETFRRLCAIDKYVRAIVCSGYDSDEMARQFLDMGFAGYLSKPFRLGDLARAIKGVLG
jgi:PAS domain S-box-containing protein